MPDYSTMYRKLLGALTDTIDDLRLITNRLIEVHQQVEDIYINAPEPTIVALPNEEESEEQ